MQKIQDFIILYFIVINFKCWIKWKHKLKIRQSALLSKLWHTCFVKSTLAYVPGFACSDKTKMPQLILFSFALNLSTILCYCLSFPWESWLKHGSSVSQWITIIFSVLIFPTEQTNPNTEMELIFWLNIDSNTCINSLGCETCPR